MKYILKSRSGRKGGNPRRAYPVDGDRAHLGDVCLVLPIDAFAGIFEKRRDAGRAAAAGGGRDRAESGAQGLP